MVGEDGWLRRSYVRLVYSSQDARWMEDHPEGVSLARMSRSSTAVDAFMTFPQPASVVPFRYPEFRFLNFGFPRKNGSRARTGRSIDFFCVLRTSAARESEFPTSLGSSGCQ